MYDLLVVFIVFFLGSFFLFLFDGSDGYHFVILSLPHYGSPYAVPVYLLVNTNFPLNWESIICDADNAFSVFGSYSLGVYHFWIYLVLGRHPEISTGGYPHRP
jgi:hypothetical protein